jgi:DNA-binding HxlR family transcriptional regulator
MDIGVIIPIGNNSELGRSLAPLFAALSQWSVNPGQVERARQEYDARDDQRAPRR